MNSKQSDEYLDQVFFALSERHRRGILKKLSITEATVSELASFFSLSLPGIMKHLGILEKAQLVKLEKNGRVRTCSFTPEGFESAAQYIEAYTKFWNDRFNDLDIFLKKSAKKKETPK